MTGWSERPGINTSTSTPSALALDPRDKPEDDNCQIDLFCTLSSLGLSQGSTSLVVVLNSPEARSAEARPTGRRTKCAPAERSRKAACVSGIKHQRR